MAVRNRNYVLIKTYNLGLSKDRIDLESDVTTLNSVGARFSIIPIMVRDLGTLNMGINVYCKTNFSRAYKTAIELGYSE